mgnify:CR=1 FL=1
MRKILFCICFCIASLASCFAQTVIYSSNDDSLGYDVKTCNLESCFQHVTLNDEIRYVKIDNGINGGKYLLIGHKNIDENDVVVLDSIHKIYCIERDFFMNGLGLLIITADSLTAYIIDDSVMFVNK